MTSIVIILGVFVLTLVMSIREKDWNIMWYNILGVFAGILIGLMVSVSTPEPEVNSVRAVESVEYITSTGQYVVTTEDGLVTTAQGSEFIVGEPTLESVSEWSRWAGLPWPFHYRDYNLVKVDPSEMVTR